MVSLLPMLARRLAIGLIGGLLAWWLGLPMPFLIGAMLITAVIGVVRPAPTPMAQAERFPRLLRQSFIAIVGVMIGQSFSPELLGLVDALWLSMLAIVPFVLLAHGAGFLVYRYMGGYDRETAIFASVPGGLIEAITFAEQSGARVGVVTVQHFARVILIFTIVPFLFFLWTGEVVGSASGVSLSQGGTTFADVAITLAVAALGMALGKRLHLPAAILIGPLLLSALLQLSGIWPAHAPAWLLNLSQLVIGVGLGSEFYGISRSQLARSLGLGLVTMVIYLLLCFVFAAGLTGVTGISFDALFLSFAPGGVTEMSLVALSLGIGPILVAAHHVCRIAVTVVAMTVLVRVLGLVKSN